jgi:hypothetical protein
MTITGSRKGGIRAMYSLFFVLAVTLGFVALVVALLGPSLYNSYENWKIRKSRDCRGE